MSPKKAAAAERWVTAVNADGAFGVWRYALARKVNQVRHAPRPLLAQRCSAQNPVFSARKAGRSASHPSPGNLNRVTDFIAKWLVDDQGAVGFLRAKCGGSRSARFPPPPKYLHE